MIRRIRDFFSRRWKALLLAALSGILYFCGYIGIDQWYLSWICMVPVLWALDDDSLSFKEALVIAWVFGWVTQLGGFPWVVGLLVRFAYLPWGVAFFAYLLLTLAQGSLLAAWGLGVNRLRKIIPIHWLAPMLLPILEWGYPAVFPHHLSNSQYRQLHFIQTLDIWGPLGITAILVLSSSVVYLLLSKKFRGAMVNPIPALVTLLVLAIGSLLYGVGAISDTDDDIAHSDRRVKVGVVQANMGIYQKTRAVREGIRRHLEQSLEVEAQGAEMIIWPESGYYKSISTTTENIKREVMGPINTPIILGALRTERVDGKRQIYNSAFLADGDGNVLGTYDKHILLAFGEYIPLGEWFPQIYDWLPQSSHFWRGTHKKALEHDGIKWGVFICYEDIMSGFVRDMVRQSAPDILVNITNDSWYGETHQPLIHMAMAAYRAIEHRRFLVRSTNTGISAIVDPVGRILQPTPVYARANIVGDVAVMSGTTIYTRLGNWPAPLFVLIIAILVVIQRRRRQANADSN